jgi:tyrosine-protein phosphatase SIW14
MQLRFISIIIPLLFSLPGQAQNRSSDDIPNLRTVENGIYRSGRPTKVGIAKLRQEMKIQTIINLEDTSYAVENERTWANSLGIKFLSFPMNSMTKPNDEDVKAILAAINDPDLQPVLVHCHHGEDRTGLIIGLHRVFTNGWASEAAYQEMMDLGFHPILWQLNRYFKDQTGYSLSSPFMEY